MLNSQYILVLCSCPNEAAASALARTLVEERLAACVNRIAAMRSTYAWKGAIEDEPEVLLLIKTTAPRYDALESRIRALHPYETPEIIALPIEGGSGHYLAWLAQETRREGDAPLPPTTQR